MAQEEKENKMSKIIIVTGANQGIGRNGKKGTQTVKELQQETKNKNICSITCDLSSFQSIHDTFKKEFTRILTADKNKKSVILINNAAECPKKRSVNNQGIERQFATNVLGYHVMIRSIFGYLLDSDNDHLFHKFIDPKSSRIVNVASDWAGDLDLNDLEFVKRAYDNDTAYKQSKQCNRMLNYVWSDKLEPFGVLVNCCHPGEPSTTLATALGYNQYSTKNCDICVSPVYLAVDDKVKTTGGWYGSDCRMRNYCKFTKSKAAKALCVKLFDICETYCK